MIPQDELAAKTGVLWRKCAVGAVGADVGKSKRASGQVGKIMDDRRRNVHARRPVGRRWRRIGSAGMTESNEY